jgi:hypothetical protein
MMHENWRGESYLVAHSHKYVNLRTHHNRVLGRANDFGKRWYSYRIVKGFGRIGVVQKRQWANSDRTFIHLACGINHKANALR